MQVTDIKDLSALTPIDPQPLEKIEFHMADDIFVKLIAIDKGGWIVKGHKHVYDHTSFLFSGSMRLWKDGELAGDFHAPTGILIQAGIEHSMLTLEDGTSWGCIHNMHGNAPEDLEEMLTIQGDKK